jgi:hypothetical protein
MVVKIHGRRSFLSLTDAGAVVRNLTPYLSNIDFPGQADTAEVSGMGQADKEYVVGLRSHSLRVQGQWTPDTGMTDETLSGLLGGGVSGTISTAFIYGPNGTDAGQIKYSGTAWVTSYGPTSPIGGAVTMSADLQITGAVLRSTF